MTALAHLENQKGKFLYRKKKKKKKEKMMSWMEII